MSRKSLKTVLKEVEQNIVKKDYVRNQLSAQRSHVYLLDSENLYNEIMADLTYRYKIKVLPSEATKVKAAATWYVEELAKAFSKNTFLKYKEGSRLKGGKLTTAVTPIKLGPGKYSIEIPSDGNNIFRRIKDIKRTYNRLLERKVARALDLDKSTFDSTGGDKSKGLIDVGHEVGSSIAETALTLTLGGSLEQIRNMAEKEEAVSIFLKKTGRSLNPVFEIRVTDEGRVSNINTAGKGERGALTAVAEAIKELINADGIDWPNVKGSPSFKDAAKAAILDAAKGKKYKNSEISSEVSSQIKTKTSRTQSTMSAPEIKLRKTQSKNWASLLPLINAKLGNSVISQMGEPSLVNRTGTFARSAKVTGVQTTPQGFPSFIMSYDKSPYGVFDRASGAYPWATPARDPYTIIERALRSILQEYAIGRFYTKRT